MKSCRTVIPLAIIAVSQLSAKCIAQSDSPDDEFEGSPWNPSRSKTRGNQIMTWRDYLSLSIRFGLFLFIICYPCFRGIRIWYMAGGRILWRRSQSGWIIGLRYQPADLDRWLILAGYNDPLRAGANETNAGERTEKLTPEEVYALPEISAPKPSDVDIESGQADELAITYHGNADGSTDKDSSAVENETISSPDGGAADESASESPSPTPLFTTTMSTSCSICIDDFEEGEKIRLLPRCGHAFHTDCILPWLTERQGCCPCCKAEVICREVTGESTNSTPGNRPTPSSYRLYSTVADREEELLSSLESRNDLSATQGGRGE